MSSVHRLHPLAHLAVWAGLVALCLALSCVATRGAEPTQIALAPQPAKAFESRSKDWPKVRAAYLALHPTCECCGTSDNLSVHHIIPIHLPAGKARELDPTNLITLCLGPGNEGGCHLRIGHFHDLHGPGNPRVRADAAYFLAKIREAKAEEAMRGVIRDGGEKHAEATARAMAIERGAP